MTTDPARVGWARRCALFVFLLLIVSAAAAPLFASQKELRDHYALIVVTVWAPGDSAAYGVHVQLRKAGSKKVLQDGYSDHSGEIAFRVPEGKADYVLTADVKSSKGMTKPQVTARVYKDERVEVSLHLTE